MEGPAEKRKRCTNFTAKEEHVLITLVKKYQHIIECKKSDTDANRLKTKYWLKIKNEFNAESGDTYREETVLRKKYDNIKKKVKKNVADQKCYMKGTGGGPPPKPTIETDMEANLKEILGSRIDGLISEFDGDATVQLETEEAELVEELDILNSNIDEQEINQTAETDNMFIEENSSQLSNICIANKEATLNWEKYTPSMLRKPQSQLLVCETTSSTDKTPRSARSLTNKLAAWATAKQNFEEVRKQCFIEEHQLKMKHLEELHQEKLKMLRNESISTSLKLHLLNDVNIET